MKDKWLQDIHDRMADYETEEPAGLWESVHAHLPQQDKADKRMLWLWTRRIGTAAAIIAVVASIGFLSTLENESVRQPVTADIPARELTAGHKNESQQLAVISGEQGTQENAGQKERTATPDTLAVNPPSSLEGDTPAPGIPLETATETNKSSDTQRQESPKEPTRPKQPYPWEAEFHIQPEQSGRISRRLAVSLFTSGGSSSSLNGRATGGQAAGTVSTPAEWKDNPMLGILLFSRGQEIETHIDHKQPVREGLSFSYKLNRHVGIESGLTYTVLLSDIKKGSRNHYFTGRQTLHYIGIPLNVKYSFFSWKQLDLYASAGILTEKRIAGKLEKKYFIDNKAEQTDKEHIKSKPIQLSANIGAGLQYNLSPAIGIYAEPGLSYYVDDHSSVQTIYKEKPFNFNFNLGLRFSFGK